MIKHKYEVTLTYGIYEHVEPVWAIDEENAIANAKKKISSWNPNCEFISIKQTI